MFTFKARKNKGGRLTRTPSSVPIKYQQPQQVVYQPQQGVQYPQGYGNDPYGQQEYRGPSAQGYPYDPNQNQPQQE